MAYRTTSRLPEADHEAGFRPMLCNPSWSDRACECVYRAIQPQAGAIETGGISPPIGLSSIPPECALMRRDLIGLLGVGDTDFGVLLECAGQPGGTRFRGS